MIERFERERRIRGEAPLEIAVLGVGKIGSTFAFQLASAGHDVTAIARPGSERLRQLRRDGAIVKVDGARAAVRVADTLDEATAFDLLIVTLLDQQAVAMLATLRRCAAKRILFMFNTFRPERVRDAIDPKRRAFGMPFVQATFDGEGRIEVAIGAGGQKTIMDDARSVDLFIAAGLPAAIERDMPLWLRCHVPLCVAFESVAVAAERRGGGASWSEAVTVARGVRESFRLIEALEYRIYPFAKRVLARTPLPIVATALWSLSRNDAFVRVLATGRNECRMLVDDMIAAAAQANVPIDVETIRALMPAADA